MTKKEFYENKKGIKLEDVIADKIVVSNKIKVNYEISKVFTLCLILPQMSGWIKYFENGGKNMSFKIEDDRVYIKYNNIWNKIKELLGGIKWWWAVIPMMTNDDQCIKTKVLMVKW